MTSQSSETESGLESRVAALEEEVGRLRLIVEPLIAVANIATPVALASLKEAAQHEFFPKFSALLDLGEVLLKYSAAIAFSFITQNRPLQTEKVLELFRQPPTLGKLTERLREVLSDPSNHEWPIDILSTTFRRNNNKPTSTARYLLDEFISIRNAEKGHGAYQSEGYYEGLYLRNNIVLHDCLRASKHIQVPLLQIHSVDHHMGQYAYKATLLMGTVPLKMSEPILSPMKVRSGSTCLWNGALLFLPLDKFVVYKYCNTCAGEHIFFTEQIAHGKIYLHSQSGNHRMNVEDTI